MWRCALSLKSVQGRKVNIGGGGGQEVLMVETGGTIKSAQGKIGVDLAGFHDKAER